MKKKTAAILAAALGMVIPCSAVQAAVNVEDLKAVVDSYLDGAGYSYEYVEDQARYDMTFSLDNNLGQTDVYIFLYDDMVSVIADSPLYFKEDKFEDMAIYTTLINNDSYYGQFRVDRDTGTVSCRTCNLLENELPGEGEIDDLVYEAVNYMEAYGDDIAAICVSDADPYELYEAYELYE